MNIYFVRHGETEFNKQVRNQFPNTPLSELGKRQAEAVAKRFTHLPIELILTSSYTRALQTAKEIEKITSATFLDTALLIERRFPSTFLGKLIDDPDIAPVHQVMRDHSDDPQWYHSDEENFTDLVSRGEAALTFIQSQQKEHIVVVTHGYFLTIMVYRILFGESVRYRSFKYFQDHTIYSNTGLTLCEYNDEKWKLLTWNDYAHLGE